MTMQPLSLVKYAALILALILLDQWSKWFIIEEYFKRGENTLNLFEWLFTLGQARLDFIRVEILSFFNLVMVWNEGVSFGMFADSHDAMPIVLSIFALILSSVFAVWLTRAERLTTAIPIAFIIAGALSNVWDRARFGAVADFFDFHLMGWHYPSFNIADSLIVLGVIILAFDTLFLEPKADKGAHSS